MTSPFLINQKKQPSKGVEPGDPYYHTADIVQVIKDNEIHLDVIDNKELIADVINVNADKCGLKNILAMYAKTGDISLFQQQPILNNFDATNIPDKSVDEIVKDLPADLVGDKSVEEFLKTITADELIKFYQAKQQSEVKQDVKEE